jgi:ferredoxin
MRVLIDVSRCQGHGRCYDLAPDVFEPDERGHAEVSVHGELPALLEAQVRVGVGNCPESALGLTAESAASHDLAIAEWPNTARRDRRCR